MSTPSNGSVVLLRWLQADSSGSPPPTSSLSSVQATSQMVRDVVVIFLAGVAIVVGLLLMTYLVMIVMDQYCCCLPGFRRPGESAEIDRGPVARKAGLWGLRQDERHLLMERILKGKPYTEDMAVVVQEKEDVDEENPIENKSTEEPSARGSDEENDDSEESQPEGSLDVDEANHDVACAICLSEYVQGEVVVTGTSCNHLFHKSCAFSWLSNHDHCPYCRKEMMTAAEMRETAHQVLGNDRVLEMQMWGPTQELMRNNFETTDDGHDGPPVTGISGSNNANATSTSAGSMIELSNAPGVHTA